MNINRHNKNVKPFPSWLLYLFMFQNLLNAGSPYFTIIINAMLAIFALAMSKYKFSRLDNHVVLYFSMIITVWILVVILYRGGVYEQQILLKYVRSFITILLIYLFIASVNISSEVVVNSLSIVFGIHVYMVLLQVPFPDLMKLTGPIFGFERELSILEQYTLRKLGASSSFDTASFWSASGVIFFYLRYNSSSRKFFLINFGAAILAGMLSSRTGMIMTMALVLCVCIHKIIIADPVKKLLFGTVLAGVFAFLFFSLYPLLLHSLGVQGLRSDEVALLFSVTDYGTTGSFQALTEDHLMPLMLPLKDLLIGYALDPNSIGRFSDIGYVKFIYHVGIIGAALIVLIHLWMMRVTAFYIFRRSLDCADRDLGIFLLWLIGAGLLFNYKSLEIYSRGTGDMIFIVFLFFLSGCKRLKYDKEVLIAKS